ncbi:MAG: alkaline phosphatase PhoX [Trichormus sp.]
MQLSRRKFFTLAGASAAGTLLMSPLEALIARKANGQLVEGYGSLVTDPNGLLDLPPGFQYRAFSRTGDLMSDGSLVPGNHDGMAAFRGPRNTVILVRNHELSPTSGTQVQGQYPYDSRARGGTTTLVVSRNRQLIRDFASLSGTIRNCAGGPTPWSSWITCEEDVTRPSPQGVILYHGYNFEVPSYATSPIQPVALVDMGRFNHEAVAVDPKTGIVYQTEDRGDSLFYRFIPNKFPRKYGDLQAGGKLQALKIKGQPPTVNTSNSGFKPGEKWDAEWVDIPNPNPLDGDTVRFQGQQLGAATFARGEGIWWGNGELYFCCTSGGAQGLGQVWRYIPGATPAQGGIIELFVESTSADELQAPDNIVVSPHGDLILCEDGSGTDYLVGVTPQGKLYQLARNPFNGSEFAGACFSPDGNTLYVNIQSPGITFAIWGPWKSRKA